MAGEKLCMMTSLLTGKKVPCPSAVTRVFMQKAAHLSRTPGLGTVIASCHRQKTPAPCFMTCVETVTKAKKETSKGTRSSVQPSPRDQSYGVNQSSSTGVLAKSGSHAMTRSQAKCDVIKKKSHRKKLSDGFSIKSGHCQRGTDLNVECDTLRVKVHKDECLDDKREILSNRESCMSTSPNQVLRVDTPTGQILVELESRDQDLCVNHPTKSCQSGEKQLKKSKTCRERESVCNKYHQPQNIYGPSQNDTGMSKVYSDVKRTLVFDPHIREDVCEQQKLNISELKLPDDSGFPQEHEARFVACSRHVQTTGSTKCEQTVQRGNHANHTGGDLQQRGLDLTSKSHNYSPISFDDYSDDKVLDVSNGKQEYGDGKRQHNRKIQEVENGDMELDNHFDLELNRCDKNVPFRNMWFQEKKCGKKIRNIDLQVSHPDAKKRKLAESILCAKSGGMSNEKHLVSRKIHSNWNPSKAFQGHHADLTKGVAIRNFDHGNIVKLKNTNSPKNVSDKKMTFLQSLLTGQVYNTDIKVSRLGQINVNSTYSVDEKCDENNGKDSVKHKTTSDGILLTARTSTKEQCRKFSPPKANVTVGIQTEHTHQSQATIESDDLAKQKTPSPLLTPAVSSTRDPSEIRRKRKMKNPKRFLMTDEDYYMEIVDINQTTDVMHSYNKYEVNDTNRDFDEEQSPVRSPSQRLCEVYSKVQAVSTVEGTPPMPSRCGESLQDQSLMEQDPSIEKTCVTSEWEIDVDPVPDQQKGMEGEWETSTQKVPFTQKNVSHQQGVGSLNAPILIEQFSDGPCPANVYMIGDSVFVEKKTSMYRVDGDLSQETHFPKLQSPREKRFKSLLTGKFVNSSSFSRTSSAGTETHTPTNRLELGCQGVISRRHSGQHDPSLEGAQDEKSVLRQQLPALKPKNGLCSLEDVISKCKERLADLKNDLLKLEQVNTVSLPYVAGCMKIGQAAPIESSNAEDDLKPARVPLWTKYKRRALRSSQGCNQELCGMPERGNPLSGAGLTIKTERDTVSEVQSTLSNDIYVMNCEKSCGKDGAAIDISATNAERACGKGDEMIDVSVRNADRVCDKGEEAVKVSATNFKRACGKGGTAILTSPSCSSGVIYSSLLTNKMYIALGNPKGEIGSSTVRFYEVEQSVAPTQRNLASHSN